MNFQLIAPELKQCNNQLEPKKNQISKKLMGIQETSKFQQQNYTKLFQDFKQVRPKPCTQGNNIR